MTSIKDGNLLSGVSSTEWREKITRQPSRLNVPDEAEPVNEDNEWLQFLKGDDPKDPVFPGLKKKKRRIAKNFSGKQRKAVQADKRGPVRGPRSNRQRKGITSGK